MENKIIDKLATKLYKKQNAENIVPKEVYSYGLQLLFQNIIIVFSIIILSVVIDSLGIGIIYIFTYVSLKVTCGGFHAKTAKGCLLASIGNYLLVTFMCKVLSNININPYCWMLIYIISLIILVIKAPLINKKHKVRKGAYKKNKLFSIYELICIMLILICGYKILNDFYVLNFIVLTVVSIVVGIIVGGSCYKFV